VDEESINTLTETYAADRRTYAAFAGSLRVLLSQLVADAGIEVDSITARAKEVDSLVDKLRRKEEYVSLEDVTDKCGARIVTRYLADIDRVCDLVASEFDVREVVVHGPERTDAFGYASRHLLVALKEPRSLLREWHSFSELVAEVQVRSILQHAWASISHGLDYKTGGEIPPAARRRLFRVAALLETGDELFDSFRDEITRIRSEYRATVEGDEWRSLALDLESIQAAWPKLPLDALVRSAIDAGWRKTKTRDPLTANPPTDEADLRDTRRLLAAAAALGINTVGELADALTTRIDDTATLSRIAEETGEEGRRPVAVGPDVATVLLATSDASGNALAAVDETRPFYPKLMEVLRGLQA
jgi:GTP pyrophosphokinase